MSKFRFLPLALLAYNHFGHAACWEAFDENESQVSYIDKCSISNEGTYKKAWLLFELKTPRTFSPKESLSLVADKMILLDYFDCKSKKTLDTRASLYFEGESIHDESVDVSNLSPSDFTDPKPDTVQEIALRTACRKSIQKSKSILGKWSKKYTDDKVNGISTVWKEPIIKKLTQDLLPLRAVDALHSYGATPMVYKNGVLMIRGGKTRDYGKEYILMIDEIEHKIWSIFSSPQDDETQESAITSECFSSSGTLRDMPFFMKDEFFNAVIYIDIKSLTGRDVCNKP